MNLENPFRVPEAQKPERSKIEEKEYQNRMNLGPRWNKRKITTEVLQERGIKLDLGDIEEYSKQRERHQMMKSSEAPGLAEEVFLEGIDTGGMTKEGRNKPYSWLSHTVVAYPSHPHDDVLRGTDAVLMFIDEENERLAHPVAVDITTNRMGYDKKFSMDLNRIRGRGLSKIYWAETAAGKGEYFDNPEGKMEALNLSVYIPKEAVNKFMNPNVSNEEADQLMAKLGPFVRRQMQAELEAQAMRLLGLNPREARRLSQKGLLTMLEAPMSGEYPAGFESAKRLLVGVLPIVWNAVDELGGLVSQREQLLPEAIQERPPLRTDAKEKRVASISNIRH
jgi:hypothetical protein